MKTAIFIILLILSGNTFAEVNLVFAGFSKHFSPAQKYNETNNTLGIEAIKGRHGFSLGVYKDSYFTTAKYAGGLYRPYKHLSVLYGFVRSPSYLNGQMIPMILPMLTGNVGRLGVNFMYLPKLVSEGDHTIGLQLKWKLK